MAGRMQRGFRHGLIWTTSAVTAIVAPHRNSHRRNGRVCMRRGASNSGWWIVVPGLLLAVLAAGACSSPERPAAAPEPDAGEPVTAPALRGAHESVDNPQETYTDERGLRVEGLGIDFPARTYPASVGLSDRDRRQASGCRNSPWPTSTASRWIFTPTGTVRGASSYSTARPYGDRTTRRSWSSCSANGKSSRRPVSRSTVSATTRSRDCGRSPTNTASSTTCCRTRARLSSGSSAS